MSRRGRPERAKKALQVAIAAVDETIAKGVIIYTFAEVDEVEMKRASHSVLLAFKSNLQAMLEDVLAWEENSTAEQEWTTSLGHIIADQWPMDLPLGEVILKAEHEFVDFIKARERYAPQIEQH